MSVRNTVILTTLPRSLPAAVRIAWIFLMQREALYAMVPGGRVPSGRAGSWPET